MAVAISSNPVNLTQALVQCASVTPKNDGAIEVVGSALTNAGFECKRVDRNGIVNLFARWGAKGHSRTFGFNGHTDVVPPGNVAEWRFDPFSGEIAEDRIWGRGTADMKSGVAAFVTAAIDFVTNTPPDGAIIVTITGDEEGVATDGTIAILDWMAEAGEAMAACIVGEPTCPSVTGDMIKIGRRGSMTAAITARGVQGHSAYPDRAKNPVKAMAILAANLSTKDLDGGTDNFDPSTLAVTTIDTGNPATNVIPDICNMNVNIRFNDAHNSDGLTEWLHSEIAAVAENTGVEFSVEVQVSGESFLTPPGPLSSLVARAVSAETGMEPELSTSGGTSDARFIRAHCPVVEFGLHGATMHQVNENVKIADIETLKAIYSRVLADYFE